MATPTRPNMAKDSEASSPSPLELGQAAAAQLGGTDWELDAEATGEVVEAPAAIDFSPPPKLPAPPHTPDPEPAPPSPEQLVEAMLFAGGHPLTAAVAGAAVRGLTPERFEE